MDVNSNPSTAESSGPVADSSPQVGGPRVNNACEACRAAKVKCTASSSQLGICRRCYESKRECVFKTGPRTRRPRQSKLNPTATRPQPPPPGPSKTFTIDVSLAQDDGPLNFDMLRDSHEAMVDRLFPPDSPPATTAPTSSSSACTRDPTWSPSFTNTTSSSAAATSPSSSSTSKAAHTAASAWSGPLRRPQFNLDSANSLLATFRDDMSLFFPVFSVPDGATVPDLARDRPFVLLALLAAASGSRTALRGGGSLYDEEFRKILGLKFVAGGERSVELLVGLLVYSAWYPVHLRPRNKQSAQYIRMAVDLIQDLELDQPEYLEQHRDQPREELLEGIRAYVACCYIVLARTHMYSRPLNLPFTAWTATCCDMLEREALTPGDRILPWLLRHQHLMLEVVGLAKDEEKGLRSPYQAATMLRGLDMQFAEYGARMPEEVANTLVMRFTTLTTQIQLLTPHLWKTSNMTRSPRVDPFQDASRMQLALPHMAAALSFMGETLLGGRQLTNICNVEWGRFVLLFIVAFTFSFDMPTCPSWDAALARSQIDLCSLLDRLTDKAQMRVDDKSRGDGTVEDEDMTIVGASRVVFGVVKAKFDKRMAAVQRQQQQQQSSIATGIWSLFGSGGGSGDAHPKIPHDKSTRGCPMFDGSLDNYIPVWDEAFTDQTSFGASVAPVNATGGFAEAFGDIDLDSGMDGAEFQPAHDLWATMTMGWAESELAGHIQPADGAEIS
ncbi:hypothetical protein MCOR31_007485 [Pyricularia oryzae]|nr:hypothetical protein MCOR31_007485 [Pyricularia oryzae]KAI6395261.1 hypothetical protein MCOR24_009347 [Pyricularia oryzae]KAI6436986.1 hypothetical protein MCOR21_000721 [Pyricularia oryzae]KAI6610146.1 hypothetical protein MCOR08_011150 [Pyricularia oryzae]